MNYMYDNLTRIFLFTKNVQNKSAGIYVSWVEGEGGGEGGGVRWEGRGTDRRVLAHMLPLRTYGTSQILATPLYSAGNEYQFSFVAEIQHLPLLYGLLQLGILCAENAHELTHAVSSLLRNQRHFYSMPT